MLNIDLIIARIIDFFSQPIIDIFGQFFIGGGWLIIFTLLIYVFFYFLIDYRQSLKTADWKYTLLAIDMPRYVKQTPKAVEQMFAHLAGILESPTLKDKIWDGFKQPWYSLEIVSLNGYIQFLIWTKSNLVQLVETAVQAQYPEAEIIEVEDYVQEDMLNYPNNKYNVWVAEFALDKDFVYPIRTYNEFEHKISEREAVLKDPMSAFLESLSKISDGEQMWFQIIIKPKDNSWKEKVIAEIKKIIAQAGPSGSDSNTQYLTPGQLKLVEDMEKKISKIGYEVKMRGVYIAEKNVFNPDRGVKALVGSINQFSIPTSNSIVVKNSVNLNKDYKKKETLLKGYKKRSLSIGTETFLLNIEELATIWHFPMSSVKTQLIKKTENKNYDIPMSLPVE